MKKWYKWIRKWSIIVYFSGSKSIVLRNINSLYQDHYNHYHLLYRLLKINSHSQPNETLTNLTNHNNVPQTTFLTYLPIIRPRFRHKINTARKNSQLVCPGKKKERADPSKKNRREQKDSPRPFCSQLASRRVYRYTFGEIRLPPLPPLSISCAGTFSELAGSRICSRAQRKRSCSAEPERPWLWRKMIHDQEQNTAFLLSRARSFCAFFGYVKTRGDSVTIPRSGGDQFFLPTVPCICWFGGEYWWFGLLIFDGVRKNGIRISNIEWLGIVFMWLHTKAEFISGCNDENCYAISNSYDKCQSYLIIKFVMWGITIYKKWTLYVCVPKYNSSVTLCTCRCSTWNSCSGQG